MTPRGTIASVTHWAELVELYEYRVADVTAGRQPRGGQAALRHLRAELLAADLDAPLRRRLVRADREFRQHQASAVQRHAEQANVLVQLPEALGSPPPAPVQAALSLGGQNSASVTGAEELNAVDYQLHVLAWHRAARHKLKRMTRDLRHEPSQPTLRVMYAVGENAERAGRGVTERFPVPVVGDPLVSLTDKDVVAQLTEHFCDLLLTEPGRQQVLRALSDVQQNPFPPTASELARREQLEVIDREPLTAHAREELRAAVLAGQTPGPDAHERPVLREATIRLRHVVQDLLGGLPPLVPKTRLLIPAPASPDAPVQEETAAQLLLDLRAAPPTFRWHGLSVRWRLIGDSWQFQVGKQIHTLRPDLPPQQRHAAVKDGKFSAQLFYQDHYVLLQLLQDLPHPLGPLAPQARLLLLLLDPADAYANLRLARAALQDWRGSQLNLAALSPESALAFTRAAPDDLQRFVREGVRMLVQRVGEQTPQQVAGSHQRCAAALKLSPSCAEILTEAIVKTVGEPEAVIAPVSVSPDSAASTQMLRLDGQFHSFQLNEEPLVIGVRNRTVTLRWNYKRALSVLIPGLANAILEDLLVLHLGELDLLLIHEGPLVALAAVP